MIVLIVLCCLGPDEVFIGTDEHLGAVLLARCTYLRGSRVRSVLSQVCVHQEGAVMCDACLARDVRAWKGVMVVDCCACVAAKKQRPRDRDGKGWLGD